MQIYTLTSASAAFRTLICGHRRSNLGRFSPFRLRQQPATSGLSPFPPCGHLEVDSILKPAIQPTRTTRLIRPFKLSRLHGRCPSQSCRSPASGANRQLFNSACANKVSTAAGRFSWGNDRYASPNTSLTVEFRITSCEQRVASRVTTKRVT
jgi:hypothetical protein